MAKTVKREPGPSRSGGEAEPADPTQQPAPERRVLRSQYLAVKNLISVKRDDITRADSDRFNSIIGEVESLHQFVRDPREQVADAEALLDIASTLMTSVKSHGNEGITPSEFVTTLLKNYSRQLDARGRESVSGSISWKDIGLSVSCIFREASGIQTMLGPMSNELKQRKTVVQRKRTRPTERTRPEEVVEDAAIEDKTDTDKNMATMFEALRSKKRVKLEALVLNRNSFAQTVENIFALSFLVKDGRAEITIDGRGHHLVSPKNAPAAHAVASGDVSYNHFVFRFDYKDWKIMKDFVGLGEELMPHRNFFMAHNSQTGRLSSQRMPTDDSSQAAAPSTPIRKLSRNRGLIVQEDSVVDDTPEGENHKRKRLFR